MSPSPSGFLGWPAVPPEFHYGKGCTLQDKNAQGDKTCQKPAASVPSCVGLTSSSYVGQPEKLPPCLQKI